MDILIYTHDKDASLVLEGVKAYFAQEFPDKKFEWKCSYARLAVAAYLSEKEITKVFRKLVKKYPMLNVEAFYSYDVREGDRSAQWWGTTRIYSTKENGETKIISSSSTYWN